MECRNTILSKISEIDSDLITRNDLALIGTLLFGDNAFNQYDNSRILDATMLLYFFNSFFPSRIVFLFS